MKKTYKYILIFILIIIISIYFNYTFNHNNYDSKIQGSSEAENIVWSNKYIYEKVQIKNIIDFIYKNINGFEPLKNKELTILRKYAKKNNLNINQIISLRNIVATQKSIDYKNTSSKYIKQILDENFSNVISLFKKYPVPPLEIINILKSKHDISPETYKIAMQYDSENTETYKKILVEANAFEDKLNNWLKTNYPSIGFKTQETLSKEQTYKYGKPYATPDILFDEPILITTMDKNGNETESLIKWIDAKNYTLVDIPFILKSIHKQADKYVSNYGPGALAFHYGFTRNIDIPMVIILDASFI